MEVTLTLDKKKGFFFSTDSAADDFLPFRFPRRPLALSEDSEDNTSDPSVNTTAVDFFAFRRPPPLLLESKDITSLGLDFLLAVATRRCLRDFRSCLSSSESSTG